MKTAEEVAREMVVVADGPEGARIVVRGFGHCLSHAARMPKDWCDKWAASLRKLFCDIITQSRADGAAAARERLQKASPIALHKPDAVRVGQVWRNVDRDRDLVVSSIDNGIAKFNAGDYMCQTKYMLEIEAWRFIREPNARTWAGRVRDDGSVVIYVGNVPVAGLGAAEVQRLAAEALAAQRQSDQPPDGIPDVVVLRLFDRIDRLKAEYQQLRQDDLDISDRVHQTKIAIVKAQIDALERAVTEDFEVGIAQRVTSMRGASGALVTAAAEQSTRPVISTGYDVQQALASISDDRAISEIEDAIVLAYEEGQRAARVAAHPTQPRDLAVYRDALERIARGDASPRDIADEALERPCEPQPPDLAGRIRALVQEYAGRWADAVLKDDASCQSSLTEVVRWLAAAANDAEAGRDTYAHILKLRTLAQALTCRHAQLYITAAADLEQAASTPAASGKQ
jgi:hypothetical protein